MDMFLLPSVGKCCFFFSLIWNNLCINDVIFFYIYINLFIFIFGCIVAAHGLSLVAASRVAVHRLLVAVASLVAEHRL